MLAIREFFRQGRAWPRAANLVQKVEGCLPTDDLPAGQMACIFRDDMLVDACRERGPKKLGKNEQCWLVPAGDVAIDVVFQWNGATLGCRVAVRFESYSELLDLLRRLPYLDEEQLAALVTSELVGVIELVCGDCDADLTELDDETRERLRAKLSLLLQTKGLRCTDLERIHVAKIGTEPSPVQEEKSEDAVEDPAVQEFQAALAERIRQVKSYEQWDNLVDDLEDEGLELDEDALVELEVTGQEIVEGHIQSGDAAVRLRQMAEDASRMAGLRRPNLRRWKGLGLRFRLMDQSPEPEETRPNEPAQQDPQSQKAARPRWSRFAEGNGASRVIRGRVADGQIQQTLQKRIEESKGELERYRGSLAEIDHKVRLRELDHELQLALDLLEIAPTLTPSQRSMRPDRKRIREIVRSLERAITATELLRAEGQELINHAPGSPTWEAALSSYRSALGTLVRELKMRQMVR